MTSCEFDDVLFLNISLPEIVFIHINYKTINILRYGLIAFLILLNNHLYYHIVFLTVKIIITDDYNIINIIIIVFHT